MNRTMSLELPLLLFSISFASAIAGYWALVRLAPAGWLASFVRPGSSTAKPVRQMGGVVAIPVTIAAVAYVPGSPAVVLALTLAGLWFVGLADDARSLKASTRLVAHFMAAALAVLLVAPEVSFTAGIMPYWLERAAAIVGVAWIINMTNFMDGMDLMTVTGFGMPLLAGGVVLAADGSTPPEAIGALALAGALAGFALFNSPPAKLYFGDNGALPAGLLAGVVVLTLSARHGLASALIPFSYYLVDSLTTLARRLADGDKIAEAHQRHAYQVALKAGWSVWRVLGVVFTTNLACIAVAFAVRSTDWTGETAKAALALMIAGTAILILRRAGQKTSQATNE